MRTTVINDYDFSNEITSDGQISWLKQESKENFIIASHRPSRDAYLARLDRSGYLCWVTRGQAGTYNWNRPVFKVDRRYKREL